MLRQFLLTAALTFQVTSRHHVSSVEGELLFNPQQPTFPIAVKGNYSVEQALPLDQPLLVVV
jgi:hypothetical protein